MPGTSLLRGVVYAATLAPVDGEKYYLVVSNNRRNANFPEALAVRLTTTPKQPRPSVVELGHPEPFVGRAICDDVETLGEDEVRRDLGALSPAAMTRIEDGLRAALGLG